MLVVVVVAFLVVTAVVVVVVAVVVEVGPCQQGMSLEARFWQNTRQLLDNCFVATLRLVPIKCAVPVVEVVVLVMVMGIREGP